MLAAIFDCIDNASPMELSDQQVAEILGCEVGEINSDGLKSLNITIASLGHKYRDLLTGNISIEAVTPLVDQYRDEILGYAT